MVFVLYFSNFSLVIQIIAKEFLAFFSFFLPQLCYARITQQPNILFFHNIITFQKYLIMFFYFRFNARPFLIYWFILRSHHMCTALIRVLLLTVRESFNFGRWISTQIQPSEENKNIRVKAIFFFLFNIIVLRIIH